MSSNCHALDFDPGSHLSATDWIVKMAGHVNASWELPPHSWLNISNCDAVTPWMAFFLVLVSEGPLPTDWNAHMPVNTVLDFLSSLVPNNWTKPTDGDLLLWYSDFFQYFYDDGSGQTLDNIFFFSISDCGPKLCPNLGFSGDADLSGIGVSLYALSSLLYRLTLTTY